MKILVTDDSATMRKIITTFLKACGYTDLVEAENGRRAWEHLELGTEFALVLLDLNMPEMDGAEFLSRVRNHPKYKTLKVVVVSTVSERKQVKTILRLGVNGYLVKPVTMDGLRKQVFPLLQPVEVPMLKEENLPPEK
jgi:two-component system chemotaxis response regulator CheY